jgi:hypothetical protein
LRIALLNPPASSSLADEKHVGSVLLRAAARDCRRSQLYPHLVALPSCIDTGRLANWAVGGRPPCRHRGVYIIDGSNEVFTHEVGG